MNPTPEEIKYLMDLAQVSNHVTILDIESFTQDPEHCLQSLLANAFIQIERWDLVVNDILLNQNILNQLRAYCKDIWSPQHNNDQTLEAWGADISVCQDVPDDIILLYCHLDPNSGVPEEEGRHVAMLKLDSLLMDRLLNLKVFW